MGLLGGRGAGSIHAEPFSESPVFRGGGRRLRRRQDGYRISDNRCMLGGKVRRVYAHLDNVSDSRSLNANSHDEISSSSDDLTGIVNSRRKILLGDALVDFFSKEATRSLKRDFSKFCRGFDIWTENKRAKVSGIDKSHFTVYSAKYFFEVLHRLTVEQKFVIQKFGFNCLLVFGKTHIPSSFIRWLACCVDHVSSQIIVDDKIINLSKDSIHFVLGLPNSGAELDDNSNGGMEFIMSLFHLSEIPHITFFGDKLKSNEPLTDQEIFVCFMQIVMSCFLCPSTNDCLDTKYTQQLGDPERASSFDLCKLVYKHLIHGITKTSVYIKAKGRRPKYFEFCSYALAVYYLDCLDFGVHIVGTGVPRAISWRGDMIKEYSELDRKSTRGFGRRRMRKDLESCYLNVTDVSKQNCMSCGTYCEPMSMQQKLTLHEEFGMTLSGKTIDGIFDTVQSFNSSQLGNCNKLGGLAHDILQFLAIARPWYKSSNTTQKDIKHLDTPVGLANNIVVKNSSITAPQMHPVAKVKSRLTLHLPENREPGFCQADLISPIGRINLSPISGCKEGSKVAGNSATLNLFQNTSKGNQQAPIHVGDTTPKAVMEATKVVGNSARGNLFENISKGNQQAPIPVGDTTPKAVTVQNSPEVTITRTTSFKDRQKQLVQNADEVYNKTMHPTSDYVIKSIQKVTSSFQAPGDVVQLVDDDHPMVKSDHDIGKRSTVNGFVTLQPKNSLFFPVAENSRFPVSDDDIMHYCAIVELAYTERIQKNYALIYHGVHCSFVSLGQTLMRDGHIDNFLIPCFCRKLFEDNHPSKSGRHYFFSYIGESILDLDSPLHEHLVRTSFLGAASASKGKRLDFSDRLFFPICHLEHWFTFLVDFKWKLFAFLDSFYSPKSDYQLAVCGPLMKIFAILWKKIFDTDEPDFKKFKVFTPNIPRQGNIHDCGVITMKSMEVFDSTKDLRQIFSGDDVGHIRIQYANRLFFHKGNKVDRNIVTNYYVKDHFMRRLHGG